MASKPRKTWGEYSPRYRRDLERHGLTEKNYRDNTPEVKAMRTAARRHTKTPERPERAARDRGKYSEYLQKREAEIRNVIERKARLFGTDSNFKTVKYRPRSSERNAMHNPKTDARPNRAYMRRFLRMTVDQILAIDWSDDEWGFLFYH